MKIKWTGIALFVASVSGAANAAFINEIDYDQPGTDNAEFVEVFVETGDSLADFAVQAINQAGALQASQVVLTSFTPGAVVSGGQLYSYTFPSNGLQNGGDDGIGLFDISGSSDVAVQLLSWEGTYTFNSVESTDVGVADGNSEPNVSIQLYDGGYILGAPTQGLANVPEPASLALIGLGTLTMLGRRRKA